MEEKEGEFVTIIDAAHADKFWKEGTIEAAGGVQYKVDCVDDVYYLYARDYQVTPNGALVFRDKSGDNLHAFAPGVWMTCNVLDWNAQEHFVGWYHKVGSLVGKTTT
jgi:hypothetical protein